MPPSETLVSKRAHGSVNAVLAALEQLRDDFCCQVARGTRHANDGQLSRGHFGVAVGTGESVNLEAADILIPGDDPRMLTEMIDLARQAQRTLMQNLFFSVAITITLVFAVVQQWYDQLWVGVLIHEVSVILVILNGARLAQNGQSIPLLKETMRSMIDDTKVAFSSFRARYFPAKA